MKKLFSLVLCSVACVTINAQNLLIYQKGVAEPTIIPVANIDYMEVKSAGHPEMTELVDIEVKNMGRFSFDVVITKGDDCVKYVVGAMKSPVYKEAEFIENAQLSLDESAFFRPYPNGIGTADMTFAERQLGLNNVENYDNDERTSINTTVAVYAIDKDGNGKVYTKEFLVPSATTAATPTATIEVSDITTDNFSISITASSDCKKLVYGVTSPDALNGTAMSAEAMISDKVAQALPVANTGTITFNVKELNTVQPNSTYYPYVIPIAEDGTLGKVQFTTVKTKAVTADGAGRILTASGTLQIEGQYMSAACPKMTFNADAAKVRLMWAPEADFSSYKSRLVEIFSKPSYKDMAWTEYDINSLPRAFVIYHPGDKYYLYAATVDKSGAVSEAQDVLALMGAASPYTTNTKSDVVPDITFDGKATATIVNDEKETKYSTYDPTKIIEVNPYFTITAGSNLSGVLVMRIDLDAADVEKAVESVLVGYPNFLIGNGGVKCHMTYNGGSWTANPANALEACTITGNSIRFKETWLTYDRLAFVTIDTNDRPRIAAVYNPNTGTLQEYK